MNEGLLWFDSDPRRPTADKIKAAAQRYYLKFGVIPTTCVVNINELDGVEVAGLQIEGAKNCLRHHYWIGVS